MAAAMPPKAAHVPRVTTARASRPNTSTRSVIGIGVSNILGKLLSIESELFGVVVFVLFTCYPLAAGKKLFSQAQSKSDRGNGKGEAGNRY